jgi:glucose-6-phosphate 1-epimerase
MTSIKRKNSLDYLEISNANARAKIALQGAHLFHFQAKGKKPLLWLSESSYFEKGKPIRGGIPVCWPWFGAHKSDKSLPNHGFARTSLWEHIATQEDKQETRVTLRLESSDETRRLWPFDFELTLEISVGAQLRLSLTTTNTGNKAFYLSQALHSYFAVSDISKVCVEGLEGKKYYNKVNDSFGNLQEGRLRFEEETDRIYEETSTPIVLRDEDETTVISSEGSHTAVVWNPGETLAKKMTDLSDYRHMLCIENANALEDEPFIQPRQSHTLSVLISQK